MFLRHIAIRFCYIFIGDLFGCKLVPLLREFLDPPRVQCFFAMTEIPWIYLAILGTYTIVVELKPQRGARSNIGTILTFSNTVLISVSYRKT